jgi:hypothetical protein
MTKRADFTKAKNQLIQKMIADGNWPIEDYLLRSTEEQQRLFALGRKQLDDGTWVIVNPKEVVTKADGKTNISGHQLALAEDIYFLIDGEIDFDFSKSADLAKQYHDEWVKLGGKPVISWDLSHYEFALS